MGCATSGLMRRARSGATGSREVAALASTSPGSQGIDEVWAIFEREAESRRRSRASLVSRSAASFSSSARCGAARLRRSQ